jgi:hypothetical protein
VSEVRDEAVGTLPESKGGSDPPKESLDEAEGSRHLAQPRPYIVRVHVYGMINRQMPNRSIKSVVSYALCPLKHQNCLHPGALHVPQALGLIRRH